MDFNANALVNTGTSTGTDAPADVPLTNHIAITLLVTDFMRHQSELLRIAADPRSTHEQREEARLRVKSVAEELIHTVDPREDPEGAEEQERLAEMFPFLFGGRWGAFGFGVPVGAGGAVEGEGGVGGDAVTVNGVGVGEVQAQVHDEENEERVEEGVRVDAVTSSSTASAANLPEHSEVNLQSSYSEELSVMD